MKKASIRNVQIDAFNFYDLLLLFYQNLRIRGFLKLKTKINSNPSRLNI